MLGSGPVILPRSTVTAAATAHLRGEIVGGGLRPGETLPESRVGELLGVSRAPVREALAILEREGLVVFDRRGTARVCRFGLAEVRELGLMRLALEPVAARLAADRRPPADIAAIEENMQELRASSRLEDVTRLDLDFHRLIVAATGNTRLTGAWGNLASQFLLVMKRFHRAWHRKTRAVRDTTLRAHTELFRAIRSGTPEEAEAVARRHATGWLSELEQSRAFAANPEGAE
jgi:DNA-binding GntR family transcriptional regulator